MLVNCKGIFDGGLCYLFNNCQLVWGTIKQSIEGIPFASHSNIIVLRSNLLLEFSEKKKTLLLYHLFIDMWFMQGTLTGHSKQLRSFGQ